MADQLLSVETIAQDARLASRVLAASPVEQRNAVLALVKAELEDRRDEILGFNQEDKAAAAEAGITGSMFKRLDLSGSKYETVLEGLAQVEALSDPVGVVTMARKLDEGLVLTRVSAPIGVLCIIFEARPDAAVQISSLAVKSGNVVILKGGREAQRSNRALVAVFQRALAAAGLPPSCVQLVDSREEVAGLLAMDRYIDLVIPRGSNALVRYIMDNTRIPVMGHADGLCAVYVHSDADQATAVKVAVDAKAQYPAVCNATETLLVHSDALPTLLPAIGAAMAEAGVAMRADPRCLPFLPPHATTPATEEDFHTEFLNLTLAVAAVDSVEAAIEHINSHGSHHTDAIVCRDQAVAERFMTAVDSASTFHNASTRFADGFRYGFGAEVGVSTHRIHARGPVGVEGLLIYKYKMRGQGHAVGDFGSGEGKKAYLHTDLQL